jgi:hypothetical protein
MFIWQNLSKYWFWYIVYPFTVCTLTNVQNNGFWMFPMTCDIESRSWRGVLDTTLCDKVCQWLTAGQWLSPGAPVSSTNKADRHDIAEILLREALNSITP